MQIKTLLEMKVQRGSESWNYIYVVLCLAVGIEAALISLVPIPFPWGLIAFGASAAVTLWLFLTNAWLQNKLVGLKNSYESKWRKVN